MESGNTAIQVGPVPTEEEMGKVREYFSRALDAIVSHADITRQVQALSGQVSQLSTRLASAEHYANNLNTSLEETRAQRNSLDQQYKATMTALHVTKSDLNNVIEDRNNLIATLDSVRENVVSLTKERDEAQFRNLELEEALQVERQKVEKVTAELKAFHDKVSSLLGNVAQAMQPEHPPAQKVASPSQAEGSGSEGKGADPFSAHGSGQFSTDTVEGQSAADPTHYSGLYDTPQSPAPASSPEASSVQEGSVGTGEPVGGGSQGEPEGASLDSILPRVVPHESGHGVDTDKSPSYKPFNEF